MSPGLIRDALNYQVNYYVDKVGVEALPLDLLLSTANRLIVHPVVRRTGLHELIHPLRQYALSYLRHSRYLDYKSWDMEQSMVFTTPHYKCYLPVAELTHGGRGDDDPEIDNMNHRRSCTMAWDLLYPERVQGLRMQGDPPNPPISLRVEVFRKDWPYLVQNGFIEPIAQCICLGNAELPCELLLGVDASQPETLGFTDVATMLSSDPHELREDDLVLARGEPAVILAVDRTMVWSLMSMWWVCLAAHNFHVMAPRLSALLHESGWQSFVRFSGGNGAGEEFRYREPHLQPVFFDVTTL